MKVTEKRVVPEHTQTVVVRKMCDLCGVESEAPHSDNWKRGTFDMDRVVIRVTISHSQGSSYPEGRFVKEFHPDICPDCFRKLVLPKLRGLGLMTRYVDVEDGLESDDPGE
jgi:hypothetical protein